MSHVLAFNFDGLFNRSSTAMQSPPLSTGRSGFQAEDHRGWSLSRCVQKLFSMIYLFFQVADHSDEEDNSHFAEYPQHHQRILCDHPRGLQPRVSANTFPHPENEQGMSLLLA
jgi:hypothetical protein